MKNRSNRTIFLIVVSILVIGFCFFIFKNSPDVQTMTSVKKALYNIHLDNLVVTPGGVEANSPSISDIDNSISFSVALNKPGDFYEFKINVKNDSSVDTIFRGYELKIGDTKVTKDNLPNFLKYSITYGDGSSLKNNGLLRAGKKQTYKIRVEYNDVDSSMMEDCDVVFNFKVVLKYRRK